MTRTAKYTWINCTRNEDLPKELKTEPTGLLDKFWNIKAIGFNIFTEYEETKFQNYYKITNHMD